MEFNGVINKRKKAGTGRTVRWTLAIQERTNEF